MGVAQSWLCAQISKVQHIRVFLFLFFLQFYDIEKLAKISKKLAELVKFTLEKHITKTFPSFCWQNLSQKNSLVQFTSYGRPGRKDACSIARLIISFTFKAFQVFCSHFSPPKEAKWMEKNLSKKKTCILCFLYFKFAS